jgi:ATP-dependent Clp protease ATP-binding subunit ClpC
MHENELGGILDMLQQRALERERETGVVFSITALEAIATLADRYFPTGTPTDKAFDLLEELVPQAQARGQEQVRKSHVEDLVSDKSHVPVGEPTLEERKKLLSLEDYLHKRVIAQDQAIGSVAKALRRARAGVGAGKKPIGSFLFLGPTGVGKTETAKALAEALFNDEEAMLRIDMSEFQGEAAIAELIGSFESGKAGRLPSLVRAKQYGVLLLDEFEKSSKDVHDLFLQILDEGHFTDSAGDRVDMRNLVIIATSNAGAKLIWQWEKEGQNLAQQKRKLIDHLVHEQLYRPEFLNRFDDIILFHPLKPEHVKKIARLHLEHNAKRIHAEQNIELQITDELVDHVSRVGYDPQFGGRPLERAIQDEVEQVLADQILAGKLKAGDTIAYNNAQFQSATPPAPGAVPTKAAAPLAPQQQHTPVPTKTGAVPKAQPPRTEANARNDERARRLMRRMKK